MTSQDADREDLLGGDEPYELVDRRAHPAGPRTSPARSSRERLDPAIESTIDEPESWSARPELGLLLGRGAAYVWTEDPRVWLLVGAAVTAQTGPVFEGPDGVTVLDGRLATARIEDAAGCILASDPSTIAIGRRAQAEPYRAAPLVPATLLSYDYEPWLRDRIARWKDREGALADAVLLGLVARFGDRRGRRMRDELHAMTGDSDSSSRFPEDESPARAAAERAGERSELLAREVLAGMVPRIVDWAEALDRLVDEVSDEDLRAHETALALRIDRDDLECARVVLAIAGHDRQCSNVLRAIDELAYDRLTTFLLAADATDDGLAHVGTYAPDLWWGEASDGDVVATLRASTNAGLPLPHELPEDDAVAPQKAAPDLPRVFLYDVNLVEVHCGTDGVPATPQYPAEGAATLHGHRLAFADESARWKGATATVVADAKASVPGVIAPLWHHQLENLDRYFGHPFHYVRTLRSVRNQTGARVDAWVYAFPEGRFAEGAPSAEYLELMRVGYARYGLDEATLAKALPPAEASDPSTGTRRRS